MLEVGPVQRVRIAKDRYRFFEDDIVLREIRDGLFRVPREHIIVYTLIGWKNQGSGGGLRTNDRVDA